VTGESIRIFLADGEPTGILVAEIDNWTGKVLVAPRSQLEQLSKREEVRRTGVYLLVGPDPDDPSRALAYIGEGDKVLKRRLSLHAVRPLVESVALVAAGLKLTPSCCAGSRWGQGWTGVDRREEYHTEHLHSSLGYLASAESAASQALSRCWCQRDGLHCDD